LRDVRAVASQGASGGPHGAARPPGQAAALTRRHAYSQRRCWRDEAAAESPLLDSTDLSLDMLRALHRVDPEAWW
jgi:hypothetical protein